jgi:acyl dehydratase
MASAEELRDGVGPADADAAGPCWFEDLEPGRVFRSQARVINAEDIASFSLLSGDHNPLHTDEEVARKTAFRGTVAHGHLVQAVASGLAWDLGIFRGTLVPLTGLAIRFLAPVRPGTSVSLELTVRVRDEDPGPRRGNVDFDAQVVDEGGKIVIEGVWHTLMGRRPSPTS